VVHVCETKVVLICVCGWGIIQAAESAQDRQLVGDDAVTDW